MNLVTVIGARPQFIKAAVVSRAIARHNTAAEKNQIQEIIIHTGQHYDSNMSDIFFQEMRIPHPQYNLELGGGQHGAMTGRMLEGIEAILLKEKPDCVLIYGDTNSTLAGALAAVKLHIPVAHVEAGLRSFNMNMPEEINRILSDRISSFLFCPTSTAVDNLAAEGINTNPQFKQMVYNVGDVMYDAALYYKQIAQTSQEIENLLKALPGFYLATIHRAENTDDPSRLSEIIKALDQISKDIPVVLPIHPRTRSIINTRKFAVKNIKIIDPVGYFDMLSLLSGCRAVFTDSGGVQKEAYFFKKPCITLRDETEWVELIANGFNLLAGADFNRIILAEKDLMSRKADYGLELYGDGDAGGKIVRILYENL